MNLANDTNYADIIKQQTALMYFTASWCGPCQKFTSILESIENKISTKIYKFAVDNQITPTQIGIKGVPTIILYRNGIEIKRHFGAGLTAEKIINFINS